MSKPRIEPVVWHPPAAPNTVSSALPTLRVFPVPGYGPEDVLIDRDGSVLAGLDDGRVIRVDPWTSKSVVVADTGGRPLGLEWLPDGRLLVCDAKLGLLAIDMDRASEVGASPKPTTGIGRIETLADRVDGQPIRICNNASVSPDGTIWFSDSSARFDFDFWKADILEHRGTGRLIRRDPDGEAVTVCGGLEFANGVALAPDGSAVFVAQTGNYSIERVPLRGPNAGNREVFVENLPGFPDNMAFGTDGLLWVGMANPRMFVADKLAPTPPIIRRWVWRLPERLQPKPISATTIMAFDLDGHVVQDVRGTHPEFGVSTGVREHNGTVWLGSLMSGTIASFNTADIEP